MGERTQAREGTGSSHDTFGEVPVASSRSRVSMTRVILDTNMLLVPGQFKVDVFTEIDRIMEEPYELVILDGSLEELKKLAAGSGDDARSAKLGQLLIDHQEKRDFAANTQCKGLKILGSSVGSHVDDAILKIAEDDTLVATNDGDLKRRLLEQGVRVIYLKQQQYLTVT